MDYNYYNLTTKSMHIGSFRIWKFRGKQGKKYPKNMYMAVSTQQLKRPIVSEIEDHISSNIISLAQYSQLKFLKVGI